MIFTKWYKNQLKMLTLIRFRSFYKKIKYCMFSTIFETNYDVVLINTGIKSKNCLPTNPSVGTNKG
jgi:hypothetical protein